MKLLIAPATWTLGLAGGALIGLAAAWLLLANGRVAGISGIVGGLLGPRPAGDTAWRWWFVAGLVAGPWLASALGVAQLGASNLPIGVLALAGLLVGVGTRLGNGCTSGHGICGLARFSKRSFAATLSFMGFGFLTVWMLRHGVTL